MRKLILTAATAGLVLTSAAGSVFAQDEEAEGPTMRVVESWTCNYNEGLDLTISITDCEHYCYKNICLY